MRKNVLFLPGLLCDAALWQHQIKVLEADFNVIIADLTRHDSMPELAKTVLASAPEKFALVGLSMGGYVAMEIMRQQPQRVERLALLDTSARPDTEEARQKRRGLIDLANRGNFKGVTPRLLPMLIAQMRLEDKALTQIIMDMAARVGMEAFLRQQWAILSRIDSRPHLKDIKVPTMVVVGEQDALTPPDICKEIADGIQGAAYHMVREAGHLTPLEKPDAVNKLLLDFLPR